MAEMMKLQRGDAVPHIRVTTVSGELFSYATVWQRRNVLLAVLGTSPADDKYATALSAGASEFGNVDTECVVTRNDVPGLTAPGVLIADKWGEIVCVVEASDSADLPGVEDLLEWAEYVRRRCPECEGEVY